MNTKKNRKFLTTLILVILASTTVLLMVGCGEKVEDGVTVIKVGTGNAYPPYCYQDETGALIGYEKALLDAVDEKLPQYQFKYQVSDFKNILVALQSGNIDIGAHQYEPNEERVQNYLFSEVPYNDYKNYIVFKSGGQKYESLKDLEGKKVRVNAGDNAAWMVEQYNENEATVQIDVQIGEGSADLIISDLETGTVDATFLTLRDIERWNKQREVQVGHSAEPINSAETFFVFKKGNTELQQAVDGALRELTESGELEAIRQKNVLDFYSSF